LLHLAAFWSLFMNASLLVLGLASLAAAPQQDVLYDFYSTSCGPCQMMMPIVERLHAEGLPVVKINISERPDLAQRFGIQVIPTFVLIIGGQERTRISGMQDESTLRGMLAQIPQRAPRPSAQPARVGRSLPVRLADDETKPKWDFHLPLPPFASKNNGMVQIDTPNSGPNSSPRSDTVLADADETPRAKSRRSDIPSNADAPLTNGQDSVVRGAAPRYAGEPDAGPDPFNMPMLASSARIRVTDEGGVYFGSGVVIDGTAGKSIVLTCGHVLRDVKPASQIEVDLFEGKNFRSYRGSILKFDLEADVGLVMLQTTSNVPASSVAGAEEKVARGEGLLSIGCSRGELPSIERLTVTMLNRYEGPDTVECTGVPVKGRSGGGLFTKSGRVVGVCTNADPQEGRGVYAGLKPIHQLLRRAGLEELIPGASKPPRSRFSDLASAPVPTGAEEQAPTKAELELAQLKQSRPKHSAAEALADEAIVRTDADPTHETEETEVICIIRPVRRTGASKVVIINRASRKFMAYLTGEGKDQLQATMGQSTTGQSPTSQPDSSAGAASGEESRSRQTRRSESVETTSAWKPSASPTRLPAH
jgi:thiol-disulfide isomerase/thioredoxin